MAKDGLEVERGVRDRDEADDERDAKSKFWDTHFLRRLPTPVWKTRETGQPLLANPAELSTSYRIRFGNAGGREFETFAFEATPKATIKFVAVAVPKGIRPSAWLIYFRHTAQAKDFSGDLLELGGGDYLFGRMNVVKQLALSGKNVGVIIPLAFGSSGEFAGNQPFVTQCLHEIETSLFGSSAKTRLLAASNSDSIFQLSKFLKGCPDLRKRLIGIYDFDGSFRRGTESITLSVQGARTFRYDGAHSPTPETRPRGETDEAFLARTMSANPARVPLALSRWREHRDFKIIRPKDDPRVRHKLGDPDSEAHSMNDFNWLHHRIPCCMLHHGLVSTPGL